MPTFASPASRRARLRASSASARSARNSGFAVVLAHGLDRQVAGAADQGEDERAGQEVGEPARQDPVQQRQEQQDDQIAVGTTIVPMISCSPREVLEHLEEREEVPLRAAPGSLALEGSAGASRLAPPSAMTTKTSTPSTATLATVSMKTCSGQNRPSVRGVPRGGDAVPAEQGDVGRQAEDQQRRQDADVQAVEPRERLVAVLGAADDDLLDEGARGPGVPPAMLVATLVAQ